MGNFRVEEDFDLGPLVTFVPNKRYPIYNWFHFKEGFSRDFVFLMLDRFRVKGGKWVLDPFCGSGTTLLSCKERAINSIGVDAMPLSIFLSQVKTMYYDIEKMKAISRNIFANKFAPTDVSAYSSMVKRSFTKYALEDIIFFKSIIARIEDPVIRNFFTLALMMSSEKVSFAYKDGSYIKIRPIKNIPPFRPLFKRTVKRMFNDLKRFGPERASVKVFQGDARNLNFLDDSAFDAVITSPPYLNIIDYMKVYSLETELFFGESRSEAIRSYIGLDVTGDFSDFSDLDIPAVGKAYLKDMKRILLEQFRVLKDGGKVAMVVGEGVFPDRIIPVHFHISELAEGVGFKVEKILYAKRRTVTDHERRKIGSALESVLLFKK
ncbi:MAG: DNA methyltransferase [Nitrososphaeria archaeon]|jgi:DNA modification methylase